MSFEPSNILKPQITPDELTFAANSDRTSVQHGYTSVQTGALSPDADDQVGLNVPLPSKRVPRRRDVARSDKTARYDSQEQSEESQSPDISHERAPVQNLPPESMILVFSFLDPISLSQCALVCRSWSRLSRDDATWRLAFATTYGVTLDAADATEHEPSKAANCPGRQLKPALRRLDHASWRAECIRRADVLRRWRKSRTPTVLTDPRISTIHAFGFSLDHHFMLSASLDYGVASRSDPFTGKVQKGFLDAAGRLNGNGIGNPNAEFAPDITALGIDADASRIVWGFRSGEVAFTLLGRQGTAPRGAIKTTSFSSLTSHHADVTCVTLPFGQSKGGAHAPNRSSEKLRQRLAALGDLAFTFVTAASNGSVHLWSPRHSAPIWTGQVRGAHQQHSSEPPPLNASISALDYNPSSGIIAAGLETGGIVVWAGIDVHALLGHPSSVHTEHAMLPTSATTSAAVDDVKRLYALVRTVIFMGRNLTADEPQIPTTGQPGPAITMIELDVDGDGSSTTSSTHLSVLTLRTGDVCVNRHHISFSSGTVERSEDISNATEVILKTTLYVQEGVSAITCFRTDFDLPRSKQSSCGNNTVAPSPARSSAPSPRIRAVDPTRKKREPLPLVIGPSASLASEVDASSPLAERKYLVAGTKNGEVLLWKYGSAASDAAQAEVDDHLPSTSTHSAQSVQAAMTLGSHPAAITCLDVSSNFIFAGTADGVIKVFDALTGSLVRIFNDRAARNVASRLLAAGELTAEEADRFTVRSIIASRETFVASIGSQVLSWRAEAIIKSRGGRRSNGQSASRTPNKRADTKFESRVELRRDVAESEAILQREREARQDEYRRLRSLADERDMNGLDEQEALQYALMLSRDEEEARRDPSVGDVHSGEVSNTIPPIALPQSLRSAGSFIRRDSSHYLLVDDTDCDLDDLAQLDDESSSYVWRSPSPSPTASPAASALSSPLLRGLGSPSRAWAIVAQASSSGMASSSASGSGTPIVPGSSSEHSKIRTIAVPRSSRHTPSPTWGPAHSQSLTSEDDTKNSSAWPSVSSLSPPRQSSSVSLGQMSSSLDVRYGSANWRRMSAGTSSPPSFSTPSNSGTHARNNLGAWKDGSPALRTPPSPVPASRPVATGSSWMPTAIDSDDTENMDDDLRFALELSLAEERSKNAERHS